MRKIQFFAPFIMLLLILSTQLHAQTDKAAQQKSAGVYVADRDLGVPLEGVRILVQETGEEFITDAKGEAVLAIPADVTRTVIFTELPGYAPKKTLIRDFTQTTIILMLMEGVLEGEELVIEEKAIGKSDEKVGVSTLVEKEMIQSAGKMGIIEDVMSAVSVLPGVIYNGGFGSYFSVRGSDPDGLTAIMDGFVVRYPYHWGGGYSIFNPNMVESVKFSAGVFSPRYGQASSGILEISTVDPTDGLRYSIVNSTSTFEVFMQSPFGKDEKGGFFAGTRLTNYDLTFQLVRSTLEDEGTTFSRIPYIYDGYMKVFYQPAETVEWYLNSFWGNDGIGVKTIDPDSDTSKEVTTDFDFTWENTDFFMNSGIKLLAGDRLFIHLLGGYEYWLARADGSFTDYGNQAYSEEYKNLYAPGSDSYYVNTESAFVNDIILRSYQLRGDTDYTIGDYLILQNGLGATLDDTDYEVRGTYYSIDFDGRVPVYRRKTYDPQPVSKKIINSFVYSNLQWEIIPGELTADIGCRIDHSYFSGDGFTVNTYPVPGPRINLRYTRKNEKSFFKENTWSIGAGLFSKTPFETLTLNKEMDIDDYDIAVPKTVMSILGWETKMPLGYRFKIETYYKHVFDRFYYNTSYDESTGREDILIHNDGTGNILGFDLLLDRRTSRYFDGMLSYSFNYARYKDPENDGITDDDNIRGRWYYPDFHRFHTLNLLLNIKPYSWMTFTTKAGFATGVPRKKYGEREMFNAEIENSDGSTSSAELYTRRAYYSDTLRTWISIPLDLKLSVHNYYKKSRIQWESYIAAEDVLSPLLKKISPENQITTNQYTGEEKMEPSSDFSFLMITLGSKISY